MTQNQLAYQANKEKERTNRMNEALTEQGNRIKGYSAETDRLKMRHQEWIDKKRLPLEEANAQSNRISAWGNIGKAIIPKFTI